jgi:hypothetical protein
MREFSWENGQLLNVSKDNKDVPIIYRGFEALMVKYHNEAGVTT